MQNSTIPSAAFNPTILTCANGLTVVIDTVPTAHSVALGIWVKAGTRDELRNQAGVAHLVEHAAFRGTATRSNIMIARGFENVGAYANAFTTKEETCYYVRSLPEHLGKVLPILADVVTKPVFRDKDVAKERKIIIEEIHAYEDEAEEFVLDLAEQYQFEKHPLGSPIVGYEQTLEQISADTVRTFHKKFYTSTNMVLTVSGNVQPAEVYDLIEQHLADIPRARTKLRRTTPCLPQVTTITERRAVHQAHIVWHRRCGGYTSADKTATSVLNVILGDGMSSRLNVKLRETSGVAYSVGSHLQHFYDIGMLTIYAGAHARRTVHSTVLIEKTLTALARDGVKKAELIRAKEQLRASRIMALESLSARLNLLGKGMLDEGKPENPYEAIADVMDVSEDHVNQLARSLCVPDEWHRLTLLPEDA
ncbi:MAG: insulinase family protein [Flavobacteriales bacterium]|nr:insulinase family protein [Flavobacteriales bacterium]